jgi:hypothetical protein
MTADRSEGKRQSAWREWFAQAFAVEPYDESSLTEDERRIIDRLAWQIERRGLITPAIFFVQSNKHFNFIGSQAAVFAQPFFEMSSGFVNSLLRYVGLNVPPKDYPHVCSAFEKRFSIEYFTQRLEAYSAGEPPLFEHEAKPATDAAQSDPPEPPA